MASLPGGAASIAVLLSGYHRKSRAAQKAWQWLGHPQGESGKMNLVWALYWVISLDWSAEDMRETPAQSDRASSKHMVKTVYLIPRQTPQ
jgi:hypothetical protein